MLSTLFVQTGRGSEGLRNLPPASRTLPSLLPKLNLLLSPQQTCNGNFFQSTSQDPQIRLATKTIKSDGLKDHKAQASERPSIRGAYEARRVASRRLRAFRQLLQVGTIQQEELSQMPPQHGPPTGHASPRAGTSLKGQEHAQPPRLPSKFGIFP